MTAQPRIPAGERIAALEADNRHILDQLNNIMDAQRSANNSILMIQKTLSELSGGKKALMALFALIGGAAGSFGTLFGMHIGK